MEKISTSTRYADNVGTLRVTADVQKDEKNGTITSVNNGNVTEENTSLSVWFNVSQDGKVSMGNIDANDSEKSAEVMDAIIKFYKEVSE